MRKSLTVYSALWSLGYCGIALADERNFSYTCTLKDIERQILVRYLVPDQDVPCEIYYQREERTELLWRANNQEGFCENEARDFADKHRHWGWKCNGHNLPEAKPRDDFY